MRKPLKRVFPVFVLPMVCAFIIGFVYPFCQGVYLSFCKFTTTSNAKLVGFENYVKAFKDSGFMHAFWYTALYAVVSVVLINVLAFTAAYALTQNIKGTNFFRTILFMPNLIGGIVLGYIWSMIFDGILSHFGTSILLETKYGFWGLIILMCWQQVGYMMIIYIAGLQAIPGDILEAADIDGASKWQTLWKVTIPNVMPSITICMFLTLTNAFKLFDQNLALTAGRPFETTVNADGILETVKTTEMLALNIYNTFYGQSMSARGTGQAKAVIFFILVAVISVLQLRSSKSKEVQQ
ncbi:MAG: sugar ABC transporter permease [Ruminococcus sp.]|nr:sugar ABC transporter permease [Ruminococcus sp.]